MNKKNFWLLHTVEDAKHSLRNGLKQDDIIFSTHDSVDTYLEYYYKIKSSSIASLLDRNMIDKVIFNSLNKIELELDKLDKEYSKSISKQIRIEYNLDYFKSMYLYSSQYRYSGLSVVLQGLEKAFSKYQNIENIYIYKSSILPDFEKMIQKDIRIISTLQKSKKKFFSKEKLKDIFRPLFYFFKSLKMHSNIIFHKKDLPTVLYWGGLYDFIQILPHLKKHNQIVYPHTDSLFPLFSWSFERPKSFQIEKRESNSPIDIIINQIIQDWNENNIKYLSSIKKLSEIQNIDFAIWGNPPAFKVKALAFNLLKKRKIPIIAYQHGSSYGYNDYFGFHIFSDYQNCNYFFSYGFSKEDLLKYWKHLDSKNLEKVANTKIVPIGRYSLELGKKENLPKIDILYPVNNSASLFDDGYIRDYAGKITNIQQNIINTISSVSDKKVVIKPFVNFNYNNCSVVPILQNLKYAKVDNRFPFKYYLANYKINIVVIDSINTTTLNETLALTNIPVILYFNQNEMKYIVQDALERLKEEIFFVESKKELKKTINGLLSGKIKNKPRGAFSSKYAKPETVENIAKELNKILGLK